MQAASDWQSRWEWHRSGSVSLVDTATTARAHATRFCARYWVSSSLNGRLDGTGCCGLRRLQGRERITLALAVGKHLVRCGVRSMLFICRSLACLSESFEARIWFTARRCITGSRQCNTLLALLSWKVLPYIHCFASPAAYHGAKLKCVSLLIVSAPLRHP